MDKKDLKQILLLRQERGQSIIIVTFAVVGILFALGLALDLGLVYIERVSLKRAIDAAVLSGVVELPEEQDAAERALNYLALNGYPLDETRVYFAGCYFDGAGNIDDVNSWKNPLIADLIDKTIPLEGDTSIDGDAYHDPKDTDPNAEINYTFWISTREHREPGSDTACDLNTPGDSNKLTITGTARVDMNFMRIVGARDFVDVFENGTAQNVDSLDVAIVFDKSGSMEFDTRCYGCWVRGDRIAPPNPDPGTYPAANGHFPAVDPTNPDTFTYPGNGRTFAVNYQNAQALELCNPTPVSNPHTYSPDGFKYMILEAELFSLNNPLMETAFLEAGKAYWNIQRGESIYGQEFQTPNAYADGTKPYIASTGHSIDGFGAHIQVMPEVSPLGINYDVSRVLTGDAPRLEYDFKFRDLSWTGDAYIWVRMHGSRGIRVTDKLWNDNTEVDLYWDVVGEADDGDLVMDTPGYVPGNIRNIQDSVTNFGAAKSYDATDTNDGGWRWRTIGSIGSPDPNNIYRLYFYASTFGFAIDRIVITNNPNGPTSDNSHSDVPTAIRNGTQPPTGGSAFRAACDPCNSIFGHDIVASGQGDLDPNDGTPDPVYSVDHCSIFRLTTPVNLGDWRINPLFSEFENPMRVAKEAVKTFATAENGLDPARDQLGFVAYNNAADYQATRTELDCVRRLGKDPCVENGYSNVLAALENVRAGGSTNIGAGMKDGLEILGIDLYDPDNQSNLNFDCGGGLCSRGSSAVRVLIVMTDGVPNETADGACDDPNDPDAQNWQPNNNAAHRCPLWFAKKAASRGVTVYVIGLGNGVEKDYLREVANQGGGQFYFSETGSDLNQVFSEILSNIYVRLVK
ncbi:MAG: vWA domain-containing protein [Chloroflexota bacterium]